MHALLCDGEHRSEDITEELHQLRITIASPDGTTEQINSPIKKTRGDRFGLSGWGQLVSFDEVSIKAAHHPDQDGDTEALHTLRDTPSDADADALTSLSLVLLNTNEFLYAE